MAEIANNHFFRRKWTMESFHSTIVSDVWPEIMFFTSWSAMVALVTELTPASLAISSQLLTVAGIVMALVISFRTTSAYERYQEGNKMWTNIRTVSRTLGQQIWLHVPNERRDDTGKVSEGQEPTEAKNVPVHHVVVEKKTMIRLIHAFAVSVKHLLRDEPGVFYEDLYDSVAFLPKFASTTDHPHDILPIWHIDGGRLMKPVTPERQDTLLNLIQSEEPPLKPAHIPPEITIYDHIGILRLPRFLIRKFLTKTHLRPEGPAKRPKKRIAYSKVVESTVPLELHTVLSSYTSFLMNNNYINVTIANGMVTSLASLQDALATLDRICNNPIPFAYQVHLRVCLWLYLFLLPFQLVGDFGYLTIPVLSFVSFLFTGLLEIGQEIANPFNYGLNDLDLDWYCNTIKLNLEEITAHPAWEPSEYIFNNLNQPFAPLDRRGAEVIMSSAVGEKKEYSPPDSSVGCGMDGVRGIFVRNWKQVECLTRKSWD